jgi:hypothetical protein
MDSRTRQALAGLAANPATPPDVLRRLLAVPEALLPMAKRPGLPEDLALALVATDDSLLAICTAVRSTSPVVRSRIAQHPDRQAREMLDYRPPAPPEIDPPSVDQLNHPEWPVRVHLARHPDLPVEWRDWLAADPHPRVRAEVLLRQDIPEPLRRQRYAQMLTEARTHNGVQIAVNDLDTDAHGLGWIRDLPADELDQYVDSPIPAFRQAIARRPDVGSRYDDDPSFPVRFTAAHRPDCPLAVLERFVASHGIIRSGETWFPLNHPNVTPEIVARLARDPAAYVRRAVAAHPEAPLAELLKDEDLAVVEAAAANPRLPQSTMARLVAAVP